MIKVDLDVDFQIGLQTDGLTDNANYRVAFVTENKNIHVLDCKKSVVQYTLYYLTLLILK